MRGKLGLFIRNPITDPSLLLHFDGTNGSTSITDSSANAITCTAEGTAEISTAQSKFGGASLLGDGAGCVVADDPLLEPGTGDFTLEAWVYLTATPVFSQLFSYRPATTASLAFYDDDGLRVNWDFGVIDAAATGLALNQWTHVAVERSAGTLKIFISGVSVGSYSGYTSNISSGLLTIGALDATDTTNGVVGYIDEARVTIGVAVYDGANFTPPTAPF
jgi:hypothetical protein